MTYYGKENKGEGEVAEEDGGSELFEGSASSLTAAERVTGLLICASDAGSVTCATSQGLRCVSRRSVRRGSHHKGRGRKGGNIGTRASVEQGSWACKSRQRTG